MLAMLHYAGFPHEMLVDETPCDVVVGLREAIETEAEILALERIGRDASWLQAKLQADYQILDDIELERSASTITSVVAYD